MTAGIYKLTSPSGKSYIGQSINLENRLNNYAKCNCKKQYLIYNAILKYGWENFEVEILWSTENMTNINDVLNQLEIKYIEEYKTMVSHRKEGHNGYNLLPGGEGFPRKTYKIWQCDTKTGEVIKEWNSVKDAEFNLNIHNIYKVLKGEYFTAGGFIWERPDNNYEVWK